MSDRIVFSTDIGRVSPKKEVLATKKTDGIVRIRRETKGRKGKGVCCIDGLPMDAIQLKTLCSTLKKLCGTGGSVKDGIIEIQGDNRDKIKAYLEKSGHQVKLSGG